MLLLLSRTLDLARSSTQSPASAASSSKAPTSAALMRPDDAGMMISLSHPTSLRCHLYDTPRRRNVNDD
jgi:hypothetical protein